MYLCKYKFAVIYSRVCDSVDLFLKGFIIVGTKKTINQGHSTHYCPLLLRERRCTTLLHLFNSYFTYGTFCSSFLYLSLFRTDFSCLFNVFSILISLFQLILTWGLFKKLLPWKRYLLWNVIVWNDNTVSWSLILKETGSEVRRGRVDDMLKLMVAVALWVICTSFF